MHIAPHLPRGRFPAIASVLALLGVWAFSVAAATPTGDSHESPIVDAAMETARALTESSGRAAAMTGVAEAYAESGRLDEARKIMAETIAADLPPALSEQLLIQAGRACVRMGMYPQASLIAARLDNA
ncbi:MAG: hypothetical protein KAX44_07480, partial [Candidatus Brocadiae bacterium]|nr:hypothetical protein [Candidatus Brocadiia bacterium]